MRTPGAPVAFVAEARTTHPSLLLISLGSGGGGKIYGQQTAGDVCLRLGKAKHRVSPSPSNEGRVRGWVIVFGGGGGRLDSHPACLNNLRRERENVTPAWNTCAARHRWRPRSWTVLLHHAIGSGAPALCSRNALCCTDYLHPPVAGPSLLRIILSVGTRHAEAGMIIPVSLLGAARQTASPETHRAGRHPNRV